MAGTNPEIKFLAADEWELLRTARLAALQDSPDAFTSHYTIEASWTEDQWRSRFDSTVWLAAVDPDVVGIAGLSNGHPPHAKHYVESIWVAPRRRRQNVSRRLITTLADTARRSELSELRLWVLEANTDAALAYKRLGFVETGERQLTGHPPQQYERGLRLDL
jgi:ribosomal protein S18 acetylase RimI-like enzyme